MTSETESQPNIMIEEGLKGSVTFFFHTAFQAHSHNIAQLSDNTAYRA